MSFTMMILQLLRAFADTFIIFIVTLLGSMPLGLLVYFCKKSKFPPLRWLTEVYISIMRGTPLILQLMVVYFGPSLIFNKAIRFDIVIGDFDFDWRYLAVIIGFIINYAAYFAEIYRSGIESIPKGQYEAAQVLGYSKGQTFVKIVLPQMIKRVIPPVTNEVITLVKDTSLASIIGTVEMFTRAKQIATSPGSPGMMTFVAAGVFYYVFNFIVSIVLKRIEKKMSYYTI